MNILELQTYSTRKVKVCKCVLDAILKDLNKEGKLIKTKIGYLHWIIW